MSRTIDALKMNFKSIKRDPDHEEPSSQYGSDVCKGDPRKKET